MFGALNKLMKMPCPPPQPELDVHANPERWVALGGGTMCGYGVVKVAQAVDLFLDMDPDPDQDPDQDPYQIRVQIRVRDPCPLLSPGYFQIFPIPTKRSQMGTGEQRTSRSDSS